jgi:signal transduction histidine kinase
VTDSRLIYTWRRLLQFMLLAAGYVAAAHIGTALAYTRAPVVAIWLPAGVAVAGLLLFGLGFWPAVALGSFIATLTTGGPLRVAPGVAIGATLGAVTAYGLLQSRWMDFRHDLGRVRDVFSLVGAVAIAPAVSTTVGAATLLVYHRLPPAAALQIWSIWWVGDFLGILLVCPMLLTWHSPTRVSRKSWWSAEAVLMLVLLVGLSWLSFSSKVPIAILLAPVLIWAALRFGQRGTSTALLIVAAVAIWNTFRGFGPFTSDAIETRLLALQIFIAVGGFTLLILGAATTERDETQEALRHARNELEQKIAERTARLGEANEKLAVELAERERAEAERRMLEVQMLQTQKLESLGLLAGGIAHDFNNLLTTILGHAELALDSLRSESPACKHIEEISRASHRAADLACQMLAYSGRVHFVAASVDLSTLVQEMLHLLEVSVSKKVRLVCRLSPSLPRVDADPTQLGQVVMNLIINASEAMADVDGTIIVTTRPIDDASSSMPADGWLGEAPSAGSYVALEVADTGCGMDAETRSKIFDPFFTTKFAGRGLGLAVVLGIVRGHKGYIRVESETGRGTKFTILLASSSKPAAVGERDARPDPQHWVGRGTVLIVDDEEGVRQLAKAMVERCGFTTVLAADGAEAVEAFRTHAGGFACVLLDMTMPRMDGAETLKELRRIRTDVPVILFSGYPQQDNMGDTEISGFTSFIQKPYHLATLASQLRIATE